MKIFYFFLLIYIFLISCNSEGKRDMAGSDHDGLYLEMSPEMMNNTILVKGEVVYVPVYSEIFHTDMSRKVKLSATLSIRNTSMDSEIIVSVVDYYDTHGKLIRHHLSSPVKLKALQTINYVVEYKEAKGGIGANFIVEWAAEKEVPEPVVEAVMIGGSSSLGISFVCEGKVIKYSSE